MRRMATQLARFRANTIPGVSSRPKEKPEVLRHHAFHLRIDAARGAISGTQLFMKQNRRPFIGHTLRKFPVFTATSRFIAHQAFLFYRIFTIKSRTFRFFEKIYAENFREIFSIFLCIIHKFQ
jgi:hypothetical protein